MGDIYPDGVQLKKGDYTIRLLLRHDSAPLLEQLKVRSPATALLGCAHCGCVARAALYCVSPQRIQLALPPPHVDATPTLPPCALLAAQALPMVVERKLETAVQVPVYRSNSGGA